MIKQAKSRKKHPGGRPSKYKPEYCQTIIDFFDYPISKTVDTDSGPKVIPLEPRFMTDFSESIGVCRDTLNEWRNKHSEFSYAYKRAKKLMIDKIVKAGLQGVYNSGVTCFTLKNIAGWRDKKEITQQITQDIVIETVDIEDRIKAIEDRQSHSALN